MCGGLSWAQQPDRENDATAAEYEMKKSRLLCHYVQDMYNNVFYMRTHIGVEAGLSLMKSTISKTGMGVTSRP